MLQPDSKQIGVKTISLSLPQLAHLTNTESGNSSCGSGSGLRPKFYQIELWQSTHAHFGNGDIAGSSGHLFPQRTTTVGQKDQLIAGKRALLFIHYSTAPWPSRVWSVNKQGANVTVRLAASRARGLSTVRSLAVAMAKCHCEQGSGTSIFPSKMHESDKLVGI